MRGISLTRQAGNVALKVVIDNLGRIFLALIAAAAFWLASANMRWYEEILANRPSDIHAPIWTTSQAVGTSVLSFSPGQPAAEISFDQFKRVAADKPYQYYFWEGWRTGTTAYSLGCTYWCITYHVKLQKGDTDTYFVAYVQIPDRRVESNWTAHTVFDPTKNEFVSLVDGPSKHNWAFSWLFTFVWWLILGGMTINLLWNLPWRKIVHRLNS